MSVYSVRGTNSYHNPTAEISVTISMKSSYDNNYTKAHRNTAASVIHVYSRHNEYSRPTTSSAGTSANNIYCHITIWTAKENFTNSQ